MDKLIRRHLASASALLVAAAFGSCASTGDTPAPQRLVGAEPTVAAAPTTAESLAAERLRAIARGDTAAVLAGYADGAILHWVGGPLDGTYATPERMAEVWAGFARAQGPLEVTIGEVGHGANPRGATVVGAAAFRGASGVVKVRHVTVWRDGKVANEVWQIDPGLAV